MHIFKNIIFASILAITLCACGGSSSQNEGWKEGTITVTVDGQEFKDEVRVYSQPDEEITMYSDKSDVEDSDGDGLIVAIFQMGNKLQFDFVDDGERYGGRVEDWQMTDDKLSGTGTLQKEGDFATQYPVAFEVSL